MLQRWYQVLRTHQNATAFAVNYDQAQLRAKALLLWRLQFRSALQSLKVARWADRFFATRRAWRLWLEKMDERKRLERLEAWNIERVRRAFNGKYKTWAVTWANHDLFVVWRLRTTKEHYLRRCENIMKDLVDKVITLLSYLACHLSLS